MSDNQPSPSSGGFRGMLWLLVAFLPCVIGIICLQTKSYGQGLIPLLLFANIIGSVAGSIGVVSGIKNEGVKVVCGALLIPVFFILNAFIVLYVGCSGGGRIAP